MCPLAPPSPSPPPSPPLPLSPPLPSSLASVELRIKALQLILSLAHTPERCNWDEHSSHLLHKLMELMQDESGEVKVLSLRVFREIIRAKPDVLKNVTELVITKIMKSCLDKEVGRGCARARVCVCLCVRTYAHMYFVHTRLYGQLY